METKLDVNVDEINESLSMMFGEMSGGIVEMLSGDVLYTEDNEDFITGINEPRYVDDLTLEMQELIYTELNRSISRMIHDLRK